MLPPPPARLPIPSTKPPVSPAVAARPAKTFSIAPWSDANEGQKFVIYGKSGIGKTTLAAMAPDPVFIGLDDGGRKISHPKTGQPVNAIQGVESYQDLRDAIRQSVKLVPDRGTLVIDTFTKVEAITEPHIFATIKTEKGHTAANMEEYGWGKGYRFLLDHDRYVLTDLEGLIRAGKNVILLCQLSQARISNSEGSDYQEDGPKLYHSNNLSTRTEVCEWADHVFRIGYAELHVDKENVKARSGKVSGDSTRAIFTGGALHFVAKARPIGGKHLPAVIAFETNQDDGLWSMVFRGGIPD